MQWLGTQFTGVHYYEHPTKKYNGRPDRNYYIQYRSVNGLRKHECVGWASTGVNGQKASLIRSEIVNNCKKGIPPFSLQEKRDMAEAEKKQKIHDAASAEKHENEQNVTFGKLAEDFLAWAKNNKKSHADDNGRYKNHIEKIIGDIPARQITGKNIDEIKTQMKISELSDKTIHHALGLIRSIYRKAIEWETYSGNIPKLAFPKFDNKRIRFLSYEEASALLDKLRTISGTIYQQSVMSLHAGLRFGEIAKLTWSDVDFQNDLLAIRDPKGIHTRLIHMTESIRNMLIELKPDKGTLSDLCFPDQNGNKQQHVSNTFYREVNKLFNKDVNDRRQRVCFHSLRHTFCSWLAMQGVSLYEIKELAGHSDIKMTVRYAHLMPETKKKAIQTLEDSFKVEARNIKKNRLRVVI